MDVFKRGTGILPVKNAPFPTKCRKESRARCPCHAASQLPLHQSELRCCETLWGSRNLAVSNGDFNPTSDKTFAGKRSFSSAHGAAQVSPSTQLPVVSYSRAASFVFPRMVRPSAR